jgi:hypothetical protein
MGSVEVWDVVLGRGGGISGCRGGEYGGRGDQTSILWTPPRHLPPRPPYATSAAYSTPYTTQEPVTESYPE